jgi:ankyrin repeat protein
MEDIKTLFHFAKNNMWDKFVDILKNNEDIDVNIRDESNNYLINYAIVQNRIDAVSALINRKSNLDMTDQDGRSILFIPIKYNYNEIVKLLLYFNKINIGILLVDMKDKNNNIPLHYAINFKNKDAIKLLIETGSDVNTIDKDGNNSLHLAVYTKDPEICSIILSSPIVVNNRKKTGESPLHLACNFQLTDIVELLIKHHADINVQDYDHEFTPLHYSITLNNNKISRLLIQAGADVNIQDFLGNTAVHYAIIEDNYEILMHILTSKFTRHKVNLNNFNIDSNLPIHLMLEKKENIILEYLINFIENSNLNFQNFGGNSALHLITSKNIWKEYKPQLIKKKLNIFIKNNENQRPIDYVPKEDFDEFINLVTQSYLYILRNRNFVWRHNWENMCNKELFRDKLTKEQLTTLKKHLQLTSTNPDICHDIVRTKLLSIYTSDTHSCGEESYPQPINKKCIQLEDTINVEFCTFTGQVLDILVGLIYLLNKHKNACSVLSPDFMENKELCNYYKTIGINTNTRCEFLNFEIVWVYYKLYMSTNFAENFKKCIANIQKQFIIIPLGIELREGSHANYLIYDKTTHELERFEPYGAQSPYRFDYKPTQLDNILETKFTDIIPDLIYIRPQDYMPKIGFQYFDTIEAKTRKIGDPGGFCALWSIWYTDYRLTYSDVNRKSLIKQMLKNIKLKNISFKNIIRNYSTNITNIRDDILKKANMNINTWINDNYTEDQIVIVIKEIVSIVNAITPQ